MSLHNCRDILFYQRPDATKPAFAGFELKLNLFKIVCKCNQKILIEIQINLQVPPALHFSKNLYQQFTSHKTPSYTRYELSLGNYDSG